MSVAQNGAVYRSAVNAPAQLITESEPQARIVFDPSGEQFAIIGSDTLQIWDTRTLRKSADVVLPPGCAPGSCLKPDQVAIAQHGSMLAMSNRGYEAEAAAITLWDANTGRAKGELLKPRKGADVDELSLSTDGRLLAAASRAGLRIWNTSTRGQLLFDDTHLLGIYHALTFDRSGHLFAAISPDGYGIRIWDLRAIATDGRPKLRQELHDLGFIHRIAISADGKWLASTGLRKEATVWDVETGARVWTVPANDNTAPVAFDRESHRVVTFAAGTDLTHEYLGARVSDECSSCRDTGELLANAKRMLRAAHIDWTR